MRGIFEVAGSRHKLHWLDVPDAVCLARLKARNAAGAHEFALTESQFHELTRYFEPPTADEGFDLVRYVMPEGDR